MKQWCCILVMAVLLAIPAPLVAGKGASGVNLVNNSGQQIFNLYIRRTGTTNWQPLAPAPPKLGKGIRGTAAFSDPDCAFDLKAILEDRSQPVWLAVNLCEVKFLTLNRNDAGVTWVDYD